MHKCKYCDIELIWQQDFSFEDVGMDGEGIASFQLCPKCDKLFMVLTDFDKDEVFIEEEGEIE